MAPTRTHDTQPESSTSTGRHRTKSNRQKRHQNQPGKDSALPGVSKIKSSLRQTRRLLAKVRSITMRCDCCANDASLQDNLAANVRVETERRLKALEAELAQAELANRERTMATRYHKVKFFGVYSSIPWSTFC